MVEPYSDGDAPTVEEAARFLGHNLWLDRRLFELVGSWVQEVADPAVTVQLDAQSRHHAWHASLWSERMPVTREIDVDAVTAATAGSAALVTGLEEAASAGDALERLAGLVRVALPRLVVARRGFLARCTPWADAALARSLRFALQDGLEDAQVGEALLQRLLRDPEAVGRATAVQARLETSLVAAGGLLGEG